MTRHPLTAKRPTLRRTALVASLAALLIAAPASASEAPLERYAADTWRSFDAMTDPQSGLPADSLAADGTRSVQTSTTNIGAYMWSTLVARELGIVDRREAVARLSRTIDSLERMERHRESGQYFNWYDHRTGEKLTIWPPTGEPRTPILSSVDNGWLAVGLRLVEQEVPELSRRAGAIYDSMDFGFYYRPDENRILFHYVPSTGEAVCCYDTIVSESRIASYIGIAKGEIPAWHYFGTWRSFPDTCDWSWQETKPLGVTRRYLGVDVFEGAYPYFGTRVTPSWGGSMFEALVPGKLGRKPLPHGAGPGGARAARGGLRLLGVLAGERAGGRLRGLRRGRGRDGPERLSVQQGPDPRGRGVPRLPRSRAEAGAPAVCLHERRGHAARGLPGTAVGTRGGAGQPRGDAAQLPGDVREVGLPRQRERGQRRGVEPLPVARPGHGDGGDRERAGAGRAPRGVRRPRHGALAPPRDRDRGVRGLPARLHDHGHARSRPAAWDVTGRRDLRRRGR